MMVSRIKTILLLFFCMVVLVSNVFAADMKMAVVDVDRLFDEYRKTVALNEEMEDEIKAKQTERDSYVEDVRRLKDELILLADANKKDKQEEIDEKIAELQRFDEKTREELSEKRNEYMREIRVELDEKVKEYGNDKGFDYVLNSKLILFHNEKYDVTDDLLQKLNK